MRRTCTLNPLGRRARFGLITIAAVVAVALSGMAAPVKGRVTGYMKLVNPVWEEFKDPDSHSYTFREPSPTVKSEYRKLFPHIPKELCVALVGKEAQPKMKDVKLNIGGGRTSPVTVVVTPGTELHFKNTDPFPHRLYAIGVKTFGPGDTQPGGERIWTVPEAGVYEIRDELVPSLRTWIVAEPNAAVFTHPDLSGAFSMELPVLGEFAVKVYFTGKEVGSSAVMDITRPNALVDLSKAPIKLEPPPSPKKAGGKPDEK